MKAITRRKHWDFSAWILGPCLGLSSGAMGVAKGGGPLPQAPTIVSPEGTKRPPFAFEARDAALLDEVQRGCFRFMWEALAPKSPMVVDRTSGAVVSVAGVGFQLAAIPIGVERGWISRKEGRERALRIVRMLDGNPENRRHGLFFHYLDGDTAGPAREGYEVVVSTIDSAILFAGMLTAGEYFGGEVCTVADRLFEGADWAAFVPADDDVEKAHERGFISLGWKPQDAKNPGGAGRLLPFYWVDSGDEQRLVTFLAVCAPKPEHRVSTEVYYRMRRAIGSDEGGAPFVWFPWSGALFTGFFAHCWIDWAGMRVDEPGLFGVQNRPRVDWWENSRRTALMHKRKAAANAQRFAGFAAGGWGLSACDGRAGYIVPGLFPSLLAVEGWRAEFDYSTVTPRDDFGEGTIAPYAAGAAIMFEPLAALEALWAYRKLKGPDGDPLVWKGIGGGEYGFRDSFNLEVGGGSEEKGGWVSADYVAIDQGPMLLGIENARSGGVWEWFRGHRWVRAGMTRMGWKSAR